MSNCAKKDKRNAMDIVPLEDFIRAAHVLKGVVRRTPLERNEVLSEIYEANIYLKREDLQIVRSFKIRGAYYKMHSLTPKQLAKGIVCASAGNHAQGVALSCKLLETHGKIFMPITTPKQKIGQVKRLGGEFIETVLKGDTFDDSYNIAVKTCEEEGKTFVHPFNDPIIIAGQGTIATEVIDQMDESPDYVFVTIGGGGLASGIGTYLRHISPHTKVIGCEPTGAASMTAAFEAGHVVSLEKLETFVDGAAVKTVGDLTYQICKEMLEDVVTVPEGKVCTSILQMYNDNAIVLEPAGALPIAALDFYKGKIKGKNVVCVISGGNNDIARMQEIKERSLLYEGLMHYFIINFPQRPGALKEFVAEVLGPNDDITRFEYMKSNNREQGPALVGIELSYAEDYEDLIKRMDAKGFHYTVINQSQQLFNLFVI